MLINHILDFYNMKLKMSKKGLSTFKGGGGVPPPLNSPVVSCLTHMISFFMHH